MPLPVGHRQEEHLSPGASDVKNLYKGKVNAGPAVGLATNHAAYFASADACDVNPKASNHARRSSPLTLRALYVAPDSAPAGALGSLPSSTLPSKYAPSAPSAYSRLSSSSTTSPWTTHAARGWHGGKHRRAMRARRAAKATPMSARQRRKTADAATPLRRANALAHYDITRFKSG